MICSFTLQGVLDEPTAFEQHCMLTAGCEDYRTRACPVSFDACGVLGLEYACNAAGSALNVTRHLLK